MDNSENLVLHVVRGCIVELVVLVNGMLLLVSSIDHVEIVRNRHRDHLVFHDIHNVAAHAVVHNIHLHAFHLADVVCRR